MFRSSGENTNDNIASILGLNGLNTMGLQDMYLDTSTLNTAATLSSAAQPNSTPDPMTVSSKKDFGALQEQQQLNATLLGNALNGGALPNMATILFQQQQAQQLRLLQQQRQQQQQQQQHLAQQQLMQQQLAFANAVNANHYHHHHQQQQQQDEISHSLKMFAMFSAYSESQSGQVDVMQDFASNGYTSDNLYRHNYNKNQLPTNTNQNLLAAAQSQQQLLQQLQAQTWLNFNYSDLRNGDDNLWRSPTPSSYMPSASKMPATSIAAAPSANVIDVIDNTLSEQNTPSKTVAAPKNQKRHNGSNKEKYASSKHCVFCENNNEPEAVIKSHSVRDSLGRVLCPKLRTYVCPICKASGDMAHTVKYCPKKPIITMEDAIKAESFRLAKSAYYKQQMKV